MGKIVAIGGGDIGQPGTQYETGPLDEEIIRLTGKKQPLLLFVGLAFPLPDAYFEVISGIYGGLYGCETINLSNSDIEDTGIASLKIANADIIYVGGGNTLRLMSIFRKYGLDKMLQDAYVNNKVLCGMSAGAICWCDYGSSDSRQPEGGSERLLRVKGLGLVHVLLCPHYNEDPRRQNDLPRMMSSTYRIPAVALDNKAALVIDGDNFKVISSGPSAAARKAYWEKGVYHLETMEQNVYKSIGLLYNRSPSSQ